MIARVFGPIATSSWPGAMFQLPQSTSTSTGTAPTAWTLKKLPG
jgi:hypothetical protein